MAYTVPSAADLKAYYTAFAAVPDATVTLYIDRANGRDVDESWIEADFAPAILAAAAHRMSRGGVLAGGSAVDASAGINSFKSASVSIEFNADAVKAAVAGGWSSTPYGLEYYEMLARNKGGPRVTGGGAGCFGYGYRSSLLGPFC